MHKLHGEKGIDQYFSEITIWKLHEHYLCDRGDDPKIKMFPVQRLKKTEIKK